MNNSRYLNNAIRQVGRVETAGLYSFGRGAEARSRGARAALGALFHRLDFNLSSLQFRRRNVLVLREPAALGAFCIIYVPMVHAQGPHPQREPHVAYTDHVNASGGIVVFYGEP